eukprot:TRINITY_DN1724_c2_g1_i1.p1 TRINITY_DN1724_c2_g1~~TRINITY_DN1724_c2_g1_i1.p1  ORF type:complete len:221 (+),score=124.31 TRINITY_DN1724_c2_g1_i1:114-776(+)
MPINYFYFGLRGRGEVIRLLLEDTKTEYVMHNVEFGQWPEMKRKGLEDGSIAFGQLPMLEDNGFHIVESNSIVRHLARKFNLYGKSANEATLCDMINDYFEEIRDKYVHMIYREGFSAAARDAHLANVTSFFGLLENQLKRNNGGNGYLVGDDVTFVDYNAFEVIEMHQRIAPANYFDAFPHLKALSTRVSTRPNVAAYLASPRRPERLNGNGKGQSADN